MEDQKARLNMESIVKIRLIVFVLAMILTAAGCSKSQPVKAEPANAQEDLSDQGADQTGQDNLKHKVLSFNLEGLSDKGTKKWDVTGESAEAISETEISLNNIVAKTYGDEGEATITGEKGMYDKVKNNVRLEQNVKATIENTEKFSGNFMDMPSEASDKDTPKKKTTTVITCDGDAQFDYKKNEASFTKNVKVVSDDGTIDADKITAYLDKDTKRVKNIVADGNVRMTRGPNTTYSQKASYAGADGKVILSGEPKIIMEKEAGLLKKDIAGE